MVALVLLLVGVVVVSKKKDDSNGTSNNSAVGSDHKKGKGLKGVTVVEFGDFQCPTCATYHSIIKEVEKKYGDDITFQFRSFPLIQIHRNAMAAHRAAEAAGKQGKFWEMHDLLYERQDSWEESANPETIMEDYASEIAINIDQFKSDFSSIAVNDLINADKKLGDAAGVSGTPTFLIDGQKVEVKELGGLENFSKKIDAAIANHKK